MKEKPTNIHQYFEALTLKPLFCYWGNILSPLQLFETTLILKKGTLHKFISQYNDISLEFFDPFGHTLQAPIVLSETIPLAEQPMMTFPADVIKVIIALDPEQAKTILNSPEISTFDC